MTDKTDDSLVYGPVPSRRLGRSLGVDVVPFKVCSFDCLYCQIGRTTVHSPERAVYVRPEQVVPQIERRLAECTRPDYITMGGSGEPTLNSALGEIIDGVRAVTDVPVALLTNGSLLTDPEVRAICCRADVVLPNLDAGDEETFRVINRPPEGLSLARIVGGLKAFRAEYEGQIWLEVFILRGVNDTEEQVGKIATLTADIRPDRVQLNTAVRPTADVGAMGVAPDKLQTLAQLFNPPAEVVAGFHKVEGASGSASRDEVIAMLRRRPCTAEDIAAGLGKHINEVLKVIGPLQEEGAVTAERREDRTYFAAAPPPG